MTIEQILIAAFGLPTVTLLSGIYHKMGKLEAANENTKEDVLEVKSEQKILWSAINRLREGRA